MNTLRFLAVALTVCFGGAYTAQAGTITYSFTGTSTITGTLNGTAFTDKTFSITQTGDTSDIVLNTFNNLFGAGSVYEVYTLPGTVSMTIDGVGTTTFTSPTDMRATSIRLTVSGNVLGGSVGFTDMSSGFPQGIAVGPPAFTDLSLPFTFTDTTGVGFPIGTLKTAAGTLNITDYSGVGTTSTMTAVGVGSTTPEPSTMAMSAMGIGLAVAFCARRRRG